MNRPRMSGWLAAACALALGGCAAPFSDLQGAHTVPKGTIELTPSYSSVAASGDGESGLLQREYTLQLGAGTGERSDWRFRFTRIDFGEGEGLNVVGLGPKFAVQPDRVAVAIPVGFAIGQGLDITETIQIHPTLFVTLPAAEAMEINLSGKVLVPIRHASTLGVAANLGAAIGPDIRRWAIRPEVGIMTFTDRGGYVRHASIGVSMNAGR